MPRAAFALALLALPVGAAACGGSGGKAGSSSTSSTSTAAPSAVVAAALRKTVAAGSEHIDLVAGGAAAGQSLRLTGSGDFDTPARNGSLNAKLTFAGTQTSLEEVQSGTAIYVSSPLFASLIPGGKKWLKVDLATAAKTFGAASSTLAAGDPAGALAQLKAITGVKDLGAATVGGVQTTHYRGRIDAAKLPASAAKALQAAGTSISGYDVWVGADGYVHRMKVATSAAANGQTVKTTLTMTLSKFGEKVSVPVPTASDTLDATNLSIPGLGG